MLRKTHIIAISVFGLMTTPAVASPTSMTADEARHLISRTGFGAAPHEIAGMIGMSYEDAVAQIMSGLDQGPTRPMPAWVDDWAYPFEQIWTLDQRSTDLFYTNRWLELEQLTAWWLAEMATTPSPLTERLVMFWSDHFANSFDAHENPQWTGKQNRFLRTHAAGNFADLADGMLHDPAMLVYLDNTQNFKDAPNENLGREFLELFTLGEGRGYTQDDVRAAARMLTGTTIQDHGTPRVILDEEGFDAGKKTIFGQTGRFDANDLVSLTLAHPEFGPYIVEKLWLTFVSDQIDQAEIDRLTVLWKANDLDLKPLLQDLFLTDAFWDKANRGRLVKSPLEMLIGTTRTFGLSMADARDLIWIAEELGQQPFLPPNVGGWPHGTAWINEATASARASTLTYLVYELEPSDVDVAPPMMAMTDEGGSPIVAANPGDLRIGQVFASYVEMREEGHGYGGSFTLYDVGFGGHNWRSISVWLEHDEEENFTSLFIYTGDCEPDCFTGFPIDDEEPGWVAYMPYDGFLDELPDITDADRALMQAVASHLPTLLSQTDGSVAYEYSEYEEPGRPVSADTYVQAAEIFKANAERQIGAHDGALVMGFSNPNALGLAGLEQAQAASSLDDYLEGRYERSAVPLIPAVTYADGRAWMNALPGTGPESARAAKAVLAVPRAAQGMREELIVGDPDALLRSLILSPAYQVK
ncbi:MAG: DUF1800 domain-containing protein [Pseudomonadota bacterium]